VSGLNVPDAIGGARQAASTTPAASASSEDRKAPRVGISASQLRDTLAAQQEERASRLRDAREKGVKLAQKKTKEARLAAEAARPKWVVPVLGYRLTAGFGEYGLWSSAHTGQDFAAPEGTPVRSIGDGTILSTGYDGAYGNKVVIQHPDGSVTWYCHLSDFLMTEGPVKAGDIIGRIGSTGNTTGPHLHLEVRPNPDVPVPPLTWMRAHGIHV
jgi:murein DD-endopeptidase MepM/ murein hydrolase activator NlpD